MTDDETTSGVTEDESEAPVAGTEDVAASEDEATDEAADPEDSEA